VGEARLKGETMTKLAKPYVAGLGLAALLVAGQLT
jgi:hypothetical protein